MVGYSSFFCRQMFEISVHIIFVSFEKEWEAMLGKILATHGSDNGLGKNTVLKEGRGNKSHPISQHHFHFAEISVVFPLFWFLVSSSRNPDLKLPVPFSQ